MPRPTDTAPPPSATIGVHHPPGHRRDQLTAALTRAGYCCSLIPPTSTAPMRTGRSDVDAFLLNPFPGWGDPGQVVAEARLVAGRRPVLVVTDSDSHRERLLALSHGADDAIGFCGDPAEIVARIGSLLRRSRWTAAMLTCSDLAIDLIGRQVQRTGQPIRLPLREFDLLARLAHSPDRVVSRSILLRSVWNIDFDPGTNRVDVHVARLRGRIDWGFAWPMLATVRGQGYALCSRPGGLISLSASAYYTKVH